MFPTEEKPSRSGFAYDFRHLGIPGCQHGHTERHQVKDFIRERDDIVRKRIKNDETKVQSAIERRKSFERDVGFNSYSSLQPVYSHILFQLWNGACWSANDKQFHLWSQLH